LAKEELNATKKKEQDVILRCKKYRKEAYEADKHNREMMVDDLKFAALDQWPDNIKQQRKGRLMLTLDKTRQGVKAVIGGMRDNRPAIKVTPADNGADPETAKVITGLIRQIEQQSSATSVYLDAAQPQVKCGYSVWRVTNEWASHDVFEQEIFIRRVKNPLNWWFDPKANEYTKADGRFVIGLSQMHRDEFKEEFPDISYTDIDELFTGEGFGDWTDDEDVIFAEFYEKVPIKKTLVLLSTGVTLDKAELDEPTLALINEGAAKIEKQREVDSYKIHYWKVTGNRAFDHRVLPNQYFTVIPVYGEVDNIEGKEIISGLIRPAKDPQRQYNYLSSSGVEAVALQPTAPFIGTFKMFAKFADLWNKSATELPSMLPYEVDKDAPGQKPERSQPPVSSSGFINHAQMAEADIKSAMGVHEASFGQESNAISGKAKDIERNSGSITNSIYLYNLAQSIEHTARVIVDMLPHYYDTMRTLRILGDDGSEETVTVNKPFMSPQGKKLEHDLTRGKYDVRYSIGPSYRSQREMAIDMLFQWGQSDPRVFQLAGDIIAKNMDIPYSAELEARFKKVLPPGLVEETDPEKLQQQQQQAQAQAQQQQQAMQIQVQDLISQIEERQSKTQLNKAKSVETIEGIQLEKAKALLDSLTKLAPTTQNEATNDRTTS